MANSFEEMTVEQVIQLTREAIMHQPPSITTDYALKIRERLDKEIAEIEAKGMTVELPHEWAWGD